ncbi:MAG: 8-amino-7-oxononanoate synthase [Acidobacteriota bacterium]|nr:8-amino-7-oxononanoate synthase [Acidobacteriota bacterium]MDH3529931.1 8-amino-7-oxononanoate synthase [Acidobacteriota bacterium]
MGKTRGGEVSGIKRRISEELEEITARGLMRCLSPPRGLDFSSNDYLGLAQNKNIGKAFIKGVKKHGVGSSGSRLLRGERDVFSEVEIDFAAWKVTESSLYFATGYQANIGIFQTFLREGDVVFSDELNHASIIDGIRLGKARKIVYPHLDLERLEEFLSSPDPAGEKFVVTESLFSMDGDIAPLDKIAAVTHKYGANLIVDEAHAVGLYGATGSGLIEEFDIGKEVFLSVNTAGKALGVSGAFVAGDETIIQYLVNRCRSFIFSTAPVPAAAAAIREAIKYVSSNPKLRRRHREICTAFADLMGGHKLEVPRNSTHIVPVLIGDSKKALRVAESMQSRGFDVRAIRPPTVPPGTSRLRISLNTKHSDSDLEAFVGILADVLDSEGQG